MRMDDEMAGGPDFELNADGLMVATREFLLRRGYCCGNGCRNCPYRGTPDDRRPLWLRDRDAMRDGGETGPA